MGCRKLLRNQVLEQRVATLTKHYSGAPKLLEAAIDYAKKAEDLEKDLGL